MLRLSRNLVPRSSHSLPLSRHFEDISILVATSSPGPSPRSKWRSENPLVKLQGCQNGSKNSLEFCHVNTLKCLCSVWTTVSDAKKQTGPPDAKTNLRKSHFIMCHVTKYSPTRLLEYFSSLGQGFSPTAILNEEKVLGTKLCQGLLPSSRHIEKRWEGRGCRGYQIDKSWESIWMVMTYTL